MNQEKTSQSSGTFRCGMCNQSFRSEEELREHNRTQHQSMGGQQTGSGAEQQFPNTSRNPGAERTPDMNREEDSSGSQRKGPGSDREMERESEQPGQTRKRAAS